MSIDITTLNNEAAVAKTFTLIGRDRGVAEWLNTTDFTATHEDKLFIKQQIIGKQNGAPLRRSLCQLRFRQVNAVSSITDEITVNLTITTPTSLAAATATQRKDAVAFVRNLVTAAVVDKLVNGEL